MQDRFDSADDRFFHRVGMFLAKWAWLDDSISSLLESFLDADSNIGRILPAYLGTDARISLVTAAAAEMPDHIILYEEKRLLADLIREVRKLKEVRNRLAHLPFTTPGAFPDGSEFQFPILSVYLARSGKPKEALLKVGDLEDCIAKAAGLDRSFSELAETIRTRRSQYNS